MKTRFLASVFVVCCLLLCGLILRRQIAAHPLPPETDQRFEAGRDGQGQGRFWMGMEGWRPATPAVSTLAHAVVSGQVAAVQAGDGPKVWGYQSRSLRRRFTTPSQLMQIIAGQYPEFIHPRSVTYEPVFTDKSGQAAVAAVLLEDGNGNQVRDDYLLVREDGQFKVGGVQRRPGPEERR